MDNNDHRICKPFQAGTHIQLRQVNTACDKRKAGDDKEHGTFISDFMPSGNRKGQLDQPQGCNVGQTGQCDRGYNAQIHV